VLIWDFDGVVADSEPVHAESYRILLGELGNSVPSGFFRRYVGRSEYEIWTMLQRDGYVLAQSFDEMAARRRNLFLSLALAELRPTWLVRDLAAAAADAATRQVVVSNGNPDIVRTLLSEWDLDELLEIADVQAAGGKAHALTTLWSAGPTVTVEDNAAFAESAQQAGSWCVFVHHSLNPGSGHGDVEVWL
jgi:beta-phosphoglucomutase-like phosphatase (HAD superfamily)